MFGTFLITWREGIEAALIVGILLTYLQKIGQEKNFRYVYWGVFWAVVASCAFALGTGYVSVILEWIGEELFESLILFLAFSVLTYMVVWMHHHAREIKGELQKKIDEAIAIRKLWALGTLAFAGVFREGVETVLFLWGLFIQTRGRESTYSPLFGGISGLFLALIMAWLFFKGFGHLDLRLFFRVTGVLLLFMAAGMLASGIGKLIRAEILPPIIDQAWNTSWLMDERNLLGSLAAGFFGYKSRPSLLEVIAYFFYFPVVLVVLRKQRHDLAQ